jgi:type IV pilus assembly protein PilP
MRRSALTVKQLVYAIAGLLLLCSCSNDDKRQDDEAYIQRIKNRRIREVEPLPEIRPYEPFAYSAYNLRSPFVAPAVQDQAKKFSLDGGIHPDSNRRKEVLEAFPLDTLRMVGTLEQNKKLWALIVDPNGAVYRLSKGNYLGQNHGRIDGITIDKVILTEIVPDPNGGWRERPTSIGLSAEMKPGENTQH